MRYCCTDCNKKFRTEGALEMHDKAKHRNRLMHRPAEVKPRFGALKVITAGAIGGIIALAMAAGLLLAVPKDEVPALTKALNKVAYHR